MVPEAQIITNADANKVRSYLATMGHPPSAADIASALRATGQIVSDEVVLAIQEGITRDTIGVGVLQPLLEIEGLTDIVVNGPDQVFIDKGIGLELTGLHFDDELAVRQLGVRLAASIGRRLDDGSPFVDARLPSGIRFHAVLEPLADPGTCLSFRIPIKRHLSMAEWERSGALDPKTARVLHRLIDKKLAFLICGGTGSGKTTLLGAMLSLVPDSQRIVIVEDSRELAPQHSHVVRLESRPVNAEGAGLVTMTDLVRQALRMRPDRLVVGEVRGGELRDLLQALNTGHEGGCGTIHANSVADLPARFEALGALGGLSPAATHAQVAAAISVVINVVRCGAARQVSEIGVLVRDGPLLQARTALRRVGDQIEECEAIDRLMELLS